MCLKAQTAHGLESRKLEALKFLFPVACPVNTEGRLEYSIRPDDRLLGDIWFMTPPGTTLQKLFSKADERNISLPDGTFVTLHIADIEELIRMKRTSAKLRTDPDDAKQDALDADILEGIFRSKGVFTKT